jgi:DNA-binding transcriptional ArsR family regulator
MGTSGCKIDILAERYGLDEREARYESLDDRLLTRWTGADGNDSVGYRQLTVWFNRQLLRTTYDEHGRDTTGNRVENDYEALTGDDELLREEVRDDLAADGIDADSLQQDFVSWSTMRTHLKNCLEGEKVIRESDSDWQRRSVEIAKNISKSKVHEALPSLEDSGKLGGGEDANVEIQVLLSCPECPTRIPFSDALDRGFVCNEHSPVAVTSEGDD